MLLEARMMDTYRLEDLGMSLWTAYRICHLYRGQCRWLPPEFPKEAAHSATEIHLSLSVWLCSTVPKTAGQFRGKSTKPIKIIASGPPPPASQRRDKSNNHCSRPRCCHRPRAGTKSTVFFVSPNPLKILQVGSALPDFQTKDSAVLEVQQFTCHHVCSSGQHSSGLSERVAAPVLKCC